VSAAPATSSAADGHAKSGKPKGKDEKLSVYRVENIIVNPSGSEGAHFLMASVAIQVEDDHVVEAMRAHDDAVRDRVISVLEKESIESLSAAGARDTLRTRIAAALASFTGSADPTHIYLPQFVIQ
jgi:flagellar basal body-associated protein FliL